VTLAWTLMLGVVFVPSPVPFAETWWPCESSTVTVAVQLPTLLTAQEALAVELEHEQDPEPDQEYVSLSLSESDALAVKLSKQSG
jgi:hypothetical protein